MNSVFINIMIDPTAFWIWEIYLREENGVTLTFLYSISIDPWL